MSLTPTQTASRRPTRADVDPDVRRAAAIVREAERREAGKALVREVERAPPTLVVVNPYERMPLYSQLLSVKQSAALHESEAKHGESLDR